MTSLASLQPQRRARVMDLLAEVGHDVTEWSNYSKGSTNAAANPRFCYEWAFVQDGHDIVLNLWFEDIREDNGTIVLNENIRRDVEVYSNRNDRSVWRRRAAKVDQAFRKAHREGVPVRVILCSGTRRDRSNPEARASRVLRRDLDPVPWAVTAYDEGTGDATIVRGVAPVRAVDQFIVDEPDDSPTERLYRSGMAFVRDRSVRDAVLARAGGRCEYCGQPGFITAAGEFFLETHHIVPLGSGGLDNVRNVAAVCPNHHREAHHGKDIEKIRRALLRKAGAKSS